jgi:hypothetical protein
VGKKSEIFGESGVGKKSEIFDGPGWAKNLNKGPRILPWRTPYREDFLDDKVPLKCTHWSLSCRYDLNQVNVKSSHL